MNFLKKQLVEKFYKFDSLRLKATNSKKRGAYSVRSKA